MNVFKGIMIATITAFSFMFAGCDELLGIEKDQWNHLVNEKEYETILEECRKYSKKYKVPLIAERHDKSKKYFLLRTSAFVLSGGGRNFPLSRNIAEQKKNGIKEYPSLRQLITEYLAGSKTE